MVVQVVGANEPRAFPHADRGIDFARSLARPGSCRRSSLLTAASANKRPNPRRNSGILCAAQLPSSPSISAGWRTASLRPPWRALPVAPRAPSSANLDAELKTRKLCTTPGRSGPRATSLHPTPLGHRARWATAVLTVSRQRCACQALASRRPPLEGRGGLAGVQGA
jgi:hypothetical protein